MGEDRLHVLLIESAGQHIQEFQPVGYVLDMTGQSTASGLRERTTHPRPIQCSEGRGEERSFRKIQGSTRHR